MNICNLDIGHFKYLNLIKKTTLRSLKNLPTTWGLRLPAHWSSCASASSSEKPPHHMGIKTTAHSSFLQAIYPLKNLPTTWELRLVTVKCHEPDLNLWKTSPPLGDNSTVNKCRLKPIFKVSDGIFYQKRPSIRRSLVYQAERPVILQPGRYPITSMPECGFFSDMQPLSNIK